MRKKIFVTGATGFVGSWLVRKLVENGEDVSIIVRNKKLTNRLLDIESKLHIYQGDLQSASLDTIIDSIKPTIVFHLAAHGALPSQQITITDLIETNLKGLIRLLTSVKRYPLDLFVNTGSSSEYGTKDIPMKESDVLQPINDYGFSKAASTLYCQKNALTEQLPIITLRLFSPYGYGDDEKRLIPFVIKKALANESISLSSKNNVRDFIYIEDVIAAYVQTMQRKISPGEIINVGSGKQHSIYDIVKQIVEISGSTSKLLWGDMPKQARQVEPKIWQADVSKAKKRLNWKPTYSLEQGLEKTIQQYKNNSYE